MTSLKLKIQFLKVWALLILSLTFAIFILALPNQTQASSNDRLYIAQADEDENESSPPQDTTAPPSSPGDTTTPEPTSPGSFGPPVSATGAAGATPADGSTPRGSIIQIPNLVPFRNLGGLFSVLITTVFFIAALAFFINLIIGGFQWLTSGGDPKALDSARARISNALIGLLIVVAAFAIVLIIESVFGIRIVSGFCIPTPGGPCPR